jgi:hypothetical protein
MSRLRAVLTFGDPLTFTTTSHRDTEAQSASLWPVSVFVARFRPTASRFGGRAYGAEHFRLRGPRFVGQVGGQSHGIAHLSEKSVEKTCNPA